MKKLVALFLVAIMALGLVPAMAETTTDYAAWFPGVDTSEHVVLTYLVTGDIPTNKTEEVLKVFNEKLTAAINAEIQIQWIEWTDWSTKYNLALAMQDGSIDLIGTATDWLDAWPNAEKGAFAPLTEEMLKTYAPKTWASVPAEHWEICKFNGEIYFAPEDNYAQWTNHGWMYRGDWAKEAGLENGVHNWEDMGKYFQYVKDNKPDVIPWDPAGSGSSYPVQMINGYLASKTDGIAIEGLPVGLFFGESKENPYTLSKFYVEGEELVEFAKLMKQWNDAGYWREDVLNYTGNTRIEMEEGLTAADQHHTQTWMTERYRMADLQPGSDLGFFWWGEERGNLVSLNITHGAMAIAAQSKHPERALMAYDLIRNDEAFYRLINYGIEGQQYIIDENGFMARPETFKEQRVDGVDFNYWWGRNDDLGLRSALVDWPIYDALIAEYDKVAITYPYGKVVFNRDPIQTELDNLSNVYNTYAPQIAFGKAEDPVAYVAEFRQALKDAGIEKVMTEIEAQLAAVYAK